MITGYSPFHGDDEEQLFNAIQTADLHFPHAVSEKAVTCIKSFLERDPNKRLGKKTSPYGPIKDHPFFVQMNWEGLVNRQVDSPFKPIIVSSTITSLNFTLKKTKFFKLSFIQKSASDINNFDTDFTNENPKLSKIDNNLVKTIDTTLFKGFSFVNEDFRRNKA